MVKAHYTLVAAYSCVGGFESGKHCTLGYTLYCQSILSVLLRRLLDAKSMEVDMGSDESEQMLGLLSELAMLKKQTGETEAHFQTEVERDAHKLRQQEIAEKIKALGTQSG